MTFHVADTSQKLETDRGPRAFTPMLLNGSNREKLASNRVKRHSFEICKSMEYSSNSIPVVVVIQRSGNVVRTEGSFRNKSDQHVT